MPQTNSWYGPGPALRIPVVCERGGKTKKPALSADEIRTPYEQLLTPTKSFRYGSEVGRTEPIPDGNMTRSRPPLGKSGVGTVVAAVLLACAAAWNVFATVATSLPGARFY